MQPHGPQPAVNPRLAFVPSALCRNMGRALQHASRLRQSPARAATCCDDGLGTEECETACALEQLLTYHYMRIHLRRQRIEAIGPMDFDLFLGDENTPRMIRDRFACAVRCEMGLVSDRAAYQLR